MISGFMIYKLVAQKLCGKFRIPNNTGCYIRNFPEMAKNSAGQSYTSPLISGIRVLELVPGRSKWLIFHRNGLKNIKQYQPGEEVIFENHGFSHDGEWLLFSSNMKLNQPVNTGTDIYKIHLKSRKLVRLPDKVTTNTPIFHQTENTSSGCRRLATVIPTISTR